MVIQLSTKNLVLIIGKGKKKKKRKIFQGIRKISPSYFGGYHQSCWFLMFKFFFLYLIMTFL